MALLLVVDDEPNVCYSVKKRLESDTLEVQVAETGRQGIELARQLRPDAAILDVRLGDMSGMEVFDRIREIDPRLPVIVITAYAATETAIEAMKRGAFEIHRGAVARGRVGGLSASLPGDGPSRLAGCAASRQRQSGQGE